MAKVLITNFHPLGGGGHVTYIQALAQRGLLHSHEIAVATPAGSRLYQRLNAAAFPRLFACDFPAKPQKKPLAVLRSLMRFHQLIRISRLDTVHGNGVDNFSRAVGTPPFRTALSRCAYASCSAPNSH